MTILIPVAQERLSQESPERTQTSQLNMQNAFSDYDKGVLIFKGSGACSELLVFSKPQRWTSESWRRQPGVRSIKEHTSYSPEQAT